MVKIDSLQYGGKNITDSNVIWNISNAITNKQSFQINNTNMGGDPQPGVQKTCILKWRYDNGGPTNQRTLAEYSTIDFGEPEITQLTYGGVNIIGRSNVIDGFKSAIRGWRRILVVNQNMGGDTKPGAQKELQITYRRGPGWPLTQFIVNEGETIYFERQIQAMYWGGSLIFNNPWVYATFNRAYQDCYLSSNSSAHMRVTNENLGGDPAPGVVKTCVIQIDGYNSWTSKPQFIESQPTEGAAWPRDPPGWDGSVGVIPGTYYEGTGKWQKTLTGPNPDAKGLN